MLAIGAGSAPDFRRSHGARARRIAAGTCSAAGRGRRSCSLPLRRACALAALCYAELAAMIPQAGSAYAYSYATLGEIVAWIIGWDLILEYAVGNVAVAISWGDYFKTLTAAAPPARVADDGISHGAAQLRSRRARLLDVGAARAGIPILVNLPAFAIVDAHHVAVAAGVKESARATTSWSW
jgi:APA family basic amino acid/polyamine antiporter